MGGRRIARPTGRRAGRGAGSGPSGSGGGGGDNGDDDGPLDPTKFKSREFLDSDDDTSSEVSSINGVFCIEVMRDARSLNWRISEILRLL